MTTPYEIPLSSFPQKFSITLNAKQYILSFSWNKFSVAWIMDIFDINNNAIAQGLPLVTGSDLLDQLHYLQMAGGMDIQTDHNTDTMPTFKNLGSESHLYWLQL